MYQTLQSVPVDKIPDIMEKVSNHVLKSGTNINGFIKDTATMPLDGSQEIMLLFMQEMVRLTIMSWAASVQRNDSKITVNDLITLFHEIGDAALKSVQATNSVNKLAIDEGWLE